ncbi:MAG TPA: ketoacyl-ACP synthase III [Anaerolineae bacterium]|nr:ketoacyl-ACP synthase III [Anaerolineae bacterium]HIQ04538.1 ketoacyl-ACP synthase III [Anaerolineae bacterium]
MESRYARITGWGSYVPPRVLTNFDLEKMVDTSDEWIVTRTGIRERRIAGEGETTSTMSIAAARQALERAGVNAAELDMIIAATSSPDFHLPPVASMIQDRLGAKDAAAFSLEAGCTGFVYGLVTGTQFIQTGTYNKVLVIGAEVISRFIDWQDRATCVLFGDGAGAVVLEASEHPEPTGVLAFELGSDGSDWDALVAYGGGSAMPFSQKVLDERKHYLRMDGRRVFKFATRTMSDAVRRVVMQSGIPWDDIELLIPHQANARIIDLAVRRLGIDPDKVMVNLDRYGNTSAASIPIALAEAVDQGKLKMGDHVVLVSFGAGLTWAAAVIHWQPVEPETPTEGILVENWPVRAQLSASWTRARNEFWSAQVTVRSRLSEAAMAVLMPLYTFTGRRRRSQRQKKE